MKSTLTREQQQSIADFLIGRDIPVGIGNEEAACSIAAINLALTGELTDKIPDCMSEVVGQWIIVIQDAMPSDLRNSEGWRKLLPLAAGTGREKEQERLNLLLAHMWEQVLPALQTIADNYNFGQAWQEMCHKKTLEAVRAAADAADAAADAADAAAVAARAADAADAAWAAAAAAWSAKAADAAKAAADAAAVAADADAAAKAARAADFWGNVVNPIKVLKTLIDLK